jgi:hypothetical protein
VQAEGWTQWQHKTACKRLQLQVHAAVSKPDGLVQCVLSAGLTCLLHRGIEKLSQI